MLLLICENSFDVFLWTPRTMAVPSVPTYEDQIHVNKNCLKQVLCSSNLGLLCGIIIYFINLANFHRLSLPERHG